MIEEIKLNCKREKKQNEYIYKYVSICNSLNDISRTCDKIENSWEGGGVGGASKISNAFIMKTNPLNPKIVEYVKRKKKKKEYQIRGKKVKCFSRSGTFWNW